MAEATDSAADSAGDVPFRGFQRSGMDEIDDAGFEQLVWVLDRQAEAPSIRWLRRWTLGRLEPRPGETAVDVGSGTGHETVALAALVGPGGRCVGVEPSRRMRALAEGRAEEAGSAATFVDGDAQDLPFDDGTVDVLRCERVFQHLDHPEQAAAEVARVLRPGGRAGIIDTDWGSAITHPGHPDVVSRLTAFQLSTWANPYSGRRLAELLRRAGLEVDSDIGSQAMVMPQEVAVSSPMVQQSSAAAVAAGAITDDERSRFLDDLATAGREGWAVLSVTMYAVIARRPR